MPCVHLKRLYQLCEEEDIKLSGGDLLQLVCTQCGVKDTCPSMLVEEFDAAESTASSDRSEEESVGE